MAEGHDCFRSKLNVGRDGIFGCCGLLARAYGRGLRPWLAGLAVAVGGGWAATPSAQPVLVPRGEPQLFVDDQLIAESHGLQRTLHQPRKDGGGEEPVLSCPEMFGYRANLQANYSIIRDPRLNAWVMYCLRFVSPLPATSADGWRRTAIIRYVSADGINWRSESPDGMECVFPRSRTDVFDQASRASQPRIDVGTIWYDHSDADWPYKAWIALVNLEAGKSGEYFFRSRDGRHFERRELVVPSRTHQIVAGGHELVGAGDTTRFAFDPGSGKFLALLKFLTNKADPVTGSRLRSRAYQFVDRLEAPVDIQKLNTVALVPENAQRNGDLPFDEYYDVSAYRYGSHWLGELKIWHGQGDYAWSAAGAAFLKLISSSDGLAWRRVGYVNDSGFAEVYLANGPEGGNDGRNDGGYMTTFCNAPLRIGNELIFYYGASSYGKNASPDRRLTGGGIFRARLRLDGFVSVDAGPLTTPALRFAGEDLRVNSAGNVTVEVLDDRNIVLGSARVSGDDVRQRVRFAGRSLRALGGDRPEVRLRFTVEPGAALYAFVIDGEN